MFRINPSFLRVFQRCRDKLAVTAAFAGVLFSAPAQTPQTGHPRLFLQAADLPRLQAWAVATNLTFGDATGVGLGVCRA